MNELSTSTILSDDTKLKSMYKLAEVMSKGNLMIPAHLKGNATDCFAVCLMATRLNLDPFALAQKSYSIKGKLGYEGQLVNALVMNSGLIQGRFHYEFQEWKDGNGYVRCGAKLKGEDDITWIEWFHTGLVPTKNSPLWKSQPKQQACYLAVRMWTRLYCPAVLLGIYTDDELREPVKKQEEKDVTPLRDIESEVVEEIDPEVIDFFEDVEDETNSSQ